LLLRADSYRKDRKFQVKSMDGRVGASPRVPTQIGNYRKIKPVLDYSVPAVVAAGTKFKNRTFLTDL